MRLIIVCIFGIFAACVQVPNSNQSQGTASPELPTVPGPPPEETPRPFDPDLDIGVAVFGANCSELFIRNSELKPGDKIQVVVANDKPHRKLIAKVQGPNNCPRYSQSGIEELVLGGGDLSPREYEIRFSENDNAESGFAVISANAEVTITNGVANLKTMTPPFALVFRECTGNESIHMTVWEGEPLRGKRVWYSYLSLSYGTVPTCSPADYK